MHINTCALPISRGFQIPNSQQHANRVLNILNLADQIEGLVYCDYEQPNFTCKPEAEFYHNVRIHSIFSWAIVPEYGGSIGNEDGQDYRSIKMLLRR
jgi:hypothetical protein